MSRYIDFNSTWQRLSDTVEKVLLSLPVERAAWTARFSDVYSICIGLPETLNEDLYKETKNFLAHHVNKILVEEIKPAGPELISEYARCWKTYYQGAKYLDYLYHHFNQQYVRKMRRSDADVEYGYYIDAQKEFLEIGELAMETWKDVLIEPMKEKLVTSVLQEISNHRHGLPANDVNSQVVIHSLVTVEGYKKKSPLKFYENTFEELFLNETKVFYREKASDLRYSLTCSDYMKQILHLLTEEEMRSRKFLHQSSCKKVTLACQQCVIFDHVKFLEDGCRNMIRNDARDDLLHMYMLLKSAPDGLSHMVNELEHHIRETGMDMIKGIREGNVSVQFVETVLEVHKRFSDLVTSLFHGDKHFVLALDSACTAVVNYHEPNQPCKAPEMVCKYCDAILRRCSKGSIEEADEKLQNSITVFRYIDDKDLFQKFYSRSLAKRLISNNCVMEMEEVMINRLKEVCGYEFTSKLHSMFTDVRLSAEHTKKFHDSVAGSKSELSTNMSVNILQAGAWPLNSTQPDFLLPEKLLKCVEKFEQFYNKQHNGRNLTWLHHLSQAEVKMQTQTKAYIIIMSTYQLAISLLFNETRVFTYRELTEQTHLQDKDLRRNVAALVDAKILLEHPSQKAGGERSLEVNESLVCKRTRFKVLVAPTQREQVQEVQQTHSSTDDDRKLYLQAAIVRIMKARKTLNHNSLVQEVIRKSKMRFSPSVSAIKRSIETLIEKSYIERVPECLDTYRYLA